MKLVDRARKQILVYGTTPFTTKDIQGVLGISSNIRMRDVIDYFLKKGEIKRVSRGLYQATPLKNALTGKKKALRAMHVKGTFASHEIAVLSDMGISYVRSLIRDLIRSDDLEAIGHRRTSKTSRIIIFRVRHTDQFYLKHVIS